MSICITMSSRAGHGHSLARSHKGVDKMNRCPHPACDMLIPKNMYACREHWDDLPEKLKSDVWKGKREDKRLWLATDKKIKAHWDKQGEG